jgi:GNAT superfamily N-acetyltransferase
MLADFSPTISLQLADREFQSASESDPHDFVIWETGSIVLKDFESDTSQTIGGFRIVLIDIDSGIREGEKIFEIFDTDEALIEYHRALYQPTSRKLRKVVRDKFSDAPPRSLNLLIVDRIIVDSKFRGIGIGLQALLALIHAHRIGVGIVAIKPWPLQFDADGNHEIECTRDENGFEFPSIGLDSRWEKSLTSAKDKLTQYYVQAGFLPLEGSGLMVLNPNRRLFG